MNWNTLLMGPAPMLAASLLYAFVCAAYLQAGKPGLAIAFGAYAVANFGFVWDLIGRV